MIASVTVAGGDAKTASAVLLTAGVVLPELPGEPGLACPLRTLTGIPCPLCGMTTAVEAAVRLQLEDAVAVNPAGVIAVAAAIAVLVLRPTRLRIWAPLVYVTLASMWVFELARFSLI
jgi:hypothetical protein